MMKRPAYYFLLCFEGTSSDALPEEEEELIAFDPDLVDRRLRVLRMLAAAIPAGVVLFVTVALVWVGANAAGLSARSGTKLSILAVAVSVGCVPLSRLISRLTTRSSIRRLAGAAGMSRAESPGETAGLAEAVLDARQSSTVAALGILEVGGLLGCIAYLLEGRATALVAPIVSVAAMAAEYPTARRVHAWLSEQAAEIERLHRSS